MNFVTVAFEAEQHAHQKLEISILKCEPEGPQHASKDNTPPKEVSAW